jgi:hypothetical protein
MKDCNRSHHLHADKSKDSAWLKFVKGGGRDEEGAIVYDGNEGHFLKSDEHGPDEPNKWWQSVMSELDPHPFPYLNPRIRQLKEEISYLELEPGALQARIDEYAKKDDELMKQTPSTAHNDEWKSKYKENKLREVLARMVQGNISYRTIPYADSQRTTEWLRTHPGKGRRHFHKGQMVVDLHEDQRPTDIFYTPPANTPQ